VGFNPNRFGFNGASGTVASVNDHVITTLEFQERVTAFENQYGEFFKNLPDAQRQYQTKAIRERVLNELINYELVYQSANDLGVYPTAAATKDIIINIPIFQQDGRFHRELYNNFLKYRNVTAGEFEGSLHRQVVVGAVRDIFMAALQTPLKSTDFTEELEATQLDVDFIKIDRSKLTANLDVSTGEAQKFAQDNSGKVNSYYSAHKDEYTTQPQIHAYHIFLKGTGADVLKKANEIRDQAKKTDFKELAKKYSEDEGSKARGGDLNFISRGQMAAEFDNAAFNLPIGKISEPLLVKTGYHLIQVSERKEGITKKIEEVQNEIAKKLLSEEKSEKLITELTQALSKKEDLAPLVARYHLKWESTGEFNLSRNEVPKINSTDAMDAVLKLKSVGEVYPNLVQSGPESYVIKLKKFQKSSAAAKMIGQNSKESSKPAQKMRSSGGDETLGMWVEETRKTARINTSAEVLK
jgi:peptidyl-prolyl cis-trans isomerase D